MICLARRKHALLARWPLGAVGWLAACSSTAAHGESNDTHDDAVLTDSCSCSPVASSRQFPCFVLLCCPSSRATVLKRRHASHRIA